MGLFHALNRKQRLVLIFFISSLPLLSFRIFHNYPSLCLLRWSNRRQKFDLISVTHYLLFESTILHALNYYTIAAQARPCCRISLVKKFRFAGETFFRLKNPPREQDWFCISVCVHAILPATQFCRNFTVVLSSGLLKQATYAGKFRSAIYHNGECFYYN